MVLSSKRTTVSVIGGGAFGTALATHAARMGHNTLIWALEKEVATAINTKHENTLFLKARTSPDLTEPRKELLTLEPNLTLLDHAGYGAAYQLEGN